VLVLADDLGFGDIGAFNPDSLIPTPNIDRLAAESVAFDDAHSSSAVCTPSRYSLLTGRHCWRSPLKSRVFYGYEPPLVEADRPTLPRMLQQLGYRTAAIGKWHLGLGYALRKGADLDLSRPLPWSEATREFEEQIDFDRPVRGGPLELGFDEFFGTSGCPTCQPPYGFIEGDRFVDPPRVYYDAPPYTGRPGMSTPGWRHADADPEILAWVCGFVRSAALADRPFFAYVALDAPHEPCTNEVVPEIARNKSQAGPRGDLVWFVDYAVGQLRAALEAAGVWRNTLFIFTSDNGALPGDRVIGADGVEVYRTYGHRSSGPWRGFKSHIWEGGHREPLVVSWPGRVAVGVHSETLVCLSDLYATIADLFGTDASAEAEDSVSFRAALANGTSPQGRRSLIHHSYSGVFALRLEDMKLVLDTKGSGGWPPPTGGGPVAGAPGQLYDLAADPGEEQDLFERRPDLATALSAELETLTGGACASNV